MLYQLEITLQHTSTPIWRRLLVDSNMTLADFYETIQIAFEWLDMHLHCFEARKTNGEPDESIYFDWAEYCTRYLFDR